MIVTGDEDLDKMDTAAKLNRNDAEINNTASAAEPSDLSNSQVAGASASARPKNREGGESARGSGT